MPAHDDHHDYHGHSLAEDLKAMEALVARRRALKWFAGASLAGIVAACGEDGGSSSTTTGTTTTATPTPTPTATATATPTPTATATASGACIVDPTETSGPYPADGTNTSSGSTSNILTSSGIVRSDIRSSFLGSSTTTATGVQLTLTLTIVNVNAACAGLSGYAVYLWCCDRQGYYSLYSAPAESYQRGVQVTDGNGQVTFTLIYPACYSGRWPHIHFEVFSSLSAAIGGNYASLTSQLALPVAACNAVYADTTTYPSSASNLASISLSSDNVFGDNSSAQIAQQTPALSGGPSSGYTGTAVIGLAR
jgi:protocatechuate 3,4-dioxygenase beta subunit